MRESQQVLAPTWHERSAPELPSTALRDSHFRSGNKCLPQPASVTPRLPARPGARAELLTRPTRPATRFLTPTARQPRRTPHCAPSHITPTSQQARNEIIQLRATGRRHGPLWVDSQGRGRAGRGGGGEGGRASLAGLLELLELGAFGSDLSLSSFHCEDASSVGRREGGHKLFRALFRLLWRK